MENNELKHHGIKGQKWGVRRFQNEDGTLTDAGHRRYNRMATWSGGMLNLSPTRNKEEYDQIMKKMEKEGNAYINARINVKKAGLSGPDKYAEDERWRKGSKEVAELFREQFNTGVKLRAKAAEVAKEYLGKYYSRRTVDDFFTTSGHRFEEYFLQQWFNKA